MGTKAPSFEDVRPVHVDYPDSPEKISPSTGHPYKIIKISDDPKYEPKTPAKPVPKRDNAHGTDIKDRSTQLQPRVHGVNYDNSQHKLEKTSRKRPSYLLEFVVHKKRKRTGEQTNATNYEDNIRERHVLEPVNNDGDDQSSDASLNMEMIGLSRKKQAYGSRHNEEANAISRQTVSSGSSPYSGDNVLTHDKIETHIERRVIAKVNSNFKTLQEEMSKKEELMLQMIESLRESIKTGSGSKVVTNYNLRRGNGKRKR